MLAAPAPGLRPGEFGARTSYALAVAGETLLVDPLVTGDDDAALGALDDLAGGRVRILVSKPFHTRSAELLWRRYHRAGARIYGHADVATRLGDTSGIAICRRCGAWPPQTPSMSWSRTASPYSARARRR